MHKLSLNVSIFDSTLGLSSTIALAIALGTWYLQFYFCGGDSEFEKTYYRVQAHFWDGGFHN